MTEWKRIQPGLYETKDGMATIAWIPGHWELSVDAEPESGIEPFVADFATLAAAKDAGTR